MPVIMLKLLYKGQLYDVMQRSNQTMESPGNGFGVNVTFRNDIDGYFFLLLSMRPVLMVLFLGLSSAFYGVLMPKTAIACLVIAAAVGTVGWFYG